MNSVPVKLPGEWRNFGTKVPFSCRLQEKDFAALYQLLDARQAECRDRILLRQYQTNAETLEDFRARKELVYQAHVTSVTIALKSGEQLTGNNVQIFDAVNDWTKVLSVFYTNPRST